MLEGFVGMEILDIPFDERMFFLFMLRLSRGFISVIPYLSVPFDPITVYDYYEPEPAPAEVEGILFKLVFGFTMLELILDAFVVDELLVVEVDDYSWNEKSFFYLL